MAEDFDARPASAFVLHADAPDDRVFVEEELVPALHDFDVRRLSDLRLGGVVVLELEAAITASDVVVVVVSPAFLAQTWMRTGEAMASSDAVSRCELVPLLFRDCDLPLRLAMRVPLDCRYSADRAAQLARLRKHLGRLSAGRLGRRSSAAIPSTIHQVERPALLRRIVEAMTPGGRVLVGLHGGGGTGKTALAADFARRHQHDYARVMWLDARARGGTTLAIAHGILDLIGRDGAGLTGLPQAIRLVWDALESFEHEQARVLVVLDNVDHPDPDFALFIDGIADASARILLTTRERSLIAAVHGVGIAVGCFEEAEAIACLRHHLDDDPRVHDMAGLSHVVARIGALPLAVRLAGIYIRRDRRLVLDDYVGQMRAPPGGRSIEAMFASTWDALTTDQRAVFVAAGVCTASGFTAVAVARTAGLDVDSADRELASLREDCVLDDDGERRYRLHPLLRDLARRSEGFVTAVGRHGDWMLAEHGNDDNDTRRMSSLGEELLTALTNAVAVGALGRHVEICRRVARRWYDNGPWLTADRELARAIEAAGQPGVAEDALADLLLARARVLYRLDRHHDALAVLATRDAIEAGGTARSRAESLRVAGRVWRELGELHQARDRFEEALRLLAGADGDELAHANTLGELAALECAEVRLDEAMAHIAEARQRWARIGDRGGIARAHHLAGVVHAARGEPERALREYEVALSIRRADGLLAAAAVTLHRMGICDVARGDRPSARARFEEGLQHYERMGQLRWIAQTLLELAALDEHDQMLDLARARAARALASYQALHGLRGDRGADAARALLARLDASR